MNNNIIRISPTNFTPEIIIDYDNHFVKFKGKSIPEDAYEFYYTITQKIKNITNLTLEVEFEYLNSASLRFLTFAINSELKLKKVIWYYNEEDFDIEEKGNLIKEIMNEQQPKVEFNVIKKS
jgi:hypothetical protein